jgi:hypothetical protein
MDKLEYLESERLKIWNELSELKVAVASKTSDHEEDAKLSSEEALVFRDNSEASSKQTKTYEENAKQSYERITALLTEYDAVETSLKDKIEYINQQYAFIEGKEKNLSSSIGSLETLVANSSDLEEKINNQNDLFTKGTDVSNKINQLFKAVSDKRNEINKLHIEIAGSEDVDEDGKKIIVPGLKNKLEETYDDLEEQANTLQDKLDTIIDDSKTNFESKMSEFDATFQAVNSKIKSLLPDALTAGLSSAYSIKRENEEKEEIKQTKHFKNAINGMIAVSLIPFIVSIYQLLDMVALDVVVMQLPRVVLAILPLYVPILWLAYSSNKKRNLSKRLIEEYTHKEVLSKTFEGLSTQIANIEDKNVSSDLQNRLLYNVLEVTSNNPGKLISDYNKSDHPFMDVLDKSTQLSNSIEKLSKVPGLGKLTSVLEKRAKKMIEDKEKEAQQGLDAIENDEE